MVVSSGTQAEETFDMLMGDNVVPTLGVVKASVTVCALAYYTLQDEGVWLHGRCY